MDKITKVNVEGDEYGFVAGQTVKGVSGALASDYVKHIILPEGAEVVEGMLVAVTFVNDNTAGYSGEKTVYSTDGINFYWDSGYTQLITLPPQGCYTVTATETQYEYKLSEYPVLIMGELKKPFCDSRGHPAGGKLWGAGDTVTVINLENRFIALQTTVNEIIQGSSLPVTSGAVYEKCNSLEPVDHVTSGNMHSVTSNAVAGALADKAPMYQRVQHIYFAPWELTNYEHLSSIIRDLFDRQNVSFITFGVNWDDYQVYPYAGSSGYFLRGDDSAPAYGQLRKYNDLKYIRAIQWIDSITPDRCSGWQSI